VSCIPLSAGVPQGSGQAGKSCPEFKKEGRKPGPPANEKSDP